MSQPTSPSPGTAGPGSFLSSLSQAHSAASETRKCINDEMEGRFEDDPNVLELLDMPDPNTPSWRAHVDTVHAAFAADAFMQNDLEFLQKVSDPAESLNNREEMMYQPLVRVPERNSFHCKPS
jgi:hypothetical protein